MNFHSLTPRPTRHFLNTVKSKGFNPHDIVSTLKNPTEVYPSKSHPGQWRVTGNGLCVVGKPEESEFVLITVYLDRVLTEVRPDQLNTPEGRRYAERRSNGLGRG